MSISSTDKKIAFVTSEYQDIEYSSGGLKLNCVLLNFLTEIGYEIDLFVDKLVKNDKNLCKNVYSINDFEKKRQEYNYILSDKAIVPSDITYVHDHSYPFRINMMSNPFAHFLYKIISRKSHNKRLEEYKKTKENLGKTKVIIVSSEILKQDIVENYGINPNSIHIISPPTEDFQILHKRNNIFTFGISAVGFKRKGGYLTISAIRRLKKLGKDFKVKFIYPSKNLWVEILLKIFGIEKFCEFLPIQNDMGKFYNSIDCLLMPSLIEPFGMVTTEALSCGVPVITAQHCGGSSFVQDGKNGFVFDFSLKTKTNLAQAMEKILNLSDVEYSEMQDFAKKSIIGLSDKDFCEKYLKILNTL